MDLISLHTNACIEHSSFSQSAKAIYDASTSSPPAIIPIVQSQSQSQSHVTKKEEEVECQQQEEQQEHQKPKSIHVMLTDLSPLCFILTPSWVSKSTKERIKILNSSNGEERRYPLIVVRVNISTNVVNVNVNNNVNLEEAPPNNNDETFLNKFASLKIGISKETGEQTVTSKVQSSHTTTTDQDVYTAISQIIAREVIARFYPADALPSKSNSSAIRSTAAAAAAADTSGNSKNRGMFRRVFSNASSAITSLMVSYDLVEDSRAYKDKWSQNDDDDDDDNDNETDDAIAFHDESIIDEDDAGVYSQNSSLESSTRKGGTRSTRTTCNSLLSQEDNIWSVDIFIECFKIITKHAVQSIRQKEEDGDEIGLTATAGSDSSTANGQGMSGSGLILNRYGDKPCSFLSLCRDAGTGLKTRSRSELGTREVALAVADLLLNLRQGPALEIILSCLLQTNKAKLSSDEDVVIVYPMSMMSRTMTMTVEEECKITVNQVDIAIFKISSAIKALERRTEVLEKQANEAQRKALAAKQMGNIKLALLCMKRRQMYLKEMENCSGSLLNLDSGLNSIQRARNDAEVLKTYELMNSSMKAIRQDSDLEKVDEVMIELEENREDLDHLHKSIYESTCSGGGAFSDEELEEELAQLMDHDDGGDANPDCTNDSTVSAISSPIVKEVEEEKEEAERSSQIPLAV